MRAPLIRRGAPGDIDALAALENRVFPGDRLSRRSLRHHLANPGSALLVADAGALAGYALLAFRAGSRAARLYSLAVDPAFGRRGVGRALLGACEAEAARRGVTELRLEVRIDNSAAIALYERRGYRRLGAVSDYYEDGAAAIRFSRRLDLAVSTKA